MRITIQRSELQRAIRATIVATAARSSLPALAHVLLSADAGKLTASATDLIHYASTSAPCDVERPGAMALPAKELEQRVTGMPDGPIMLLDVEGRAELRSLSTRRRFSLGVLPSGEFPQLPTVDGEAVDVASAELAALIDGCAYAVSTDTTRGLLTCAALSCADGVFRSAASDGHRAVTMSAASSAGGYMPEMIISRGALAGIRALCDSAEIVTLRKSSAWIFASASGVDLGAKRLDADQSFPRMARFFPPDSPPARVDTKDLIGALRSVSQAADERGGQVKITLSSGSITLRSQGAAGEGFDQLDAAYDGEDVTIACMARYLIDALDHVGSSEAAIMCGGDMQPVVVKPWTSSGIGDGYAALVMPLRA